MNLFNPQFLLFLALLLLVAGFLLFYMDMKMREQNHKIKAIADLATTIAQSIKGGNNINNNNNEPAKENIELITVSDDDEDDDETSSDDDDSSSDDDESSSDDDDEDDIKVKQEPLKLNINIYENDDIKHVFLSQEQLPEIKEEEEEEPLEPHEESESTLLPEPQEPTSSSDGFKIILSSELDYKKMTITKLRQIVTEKGLVPSSDASKMKKTELLKLLEAE
jgi:hypothetical protein